MLFCKMLYKTVQNWSAECPDQCYRTASYVSERKLLMPLLLFIMMTQVVGTRLKHKSIIPKYVQSLLLLHCFISRSVPHLPLTRLTSNHLVYEGHIRVRNRYTSCYGKCLYSQGLFVFHIHRQDCRDFVQCLCNKHGWIQDFVLEGA